MTDPAPDAQPQTDPSPDAAEPAKADTDWQAEARKWEKRAKDNQAKLRELQPQLNEWQQAREAGKTDVERAQEELARWQEEAQQWRSRAVLSRVEALAATDFADPSDALATLDPDEYLSDDGQIDEKALRADLADLLERKPHWRKAGGALPAGPPSFDGGARTTAPAAPDMNALIRQAAGRA